MLARATVDRDGFDHAQREDAQPSLERAGGRGGELTAEREEGLDEPRGGARRVDTEGDGLRVVDVGDGEVMEGVGEEHPGVVALELVGGALEVDHAAWMRPGLRGLRGGLA